MLENYLKYLTLVCKKFARKNDILDIVLYGSAVKSKEEIRDIDILLIFLNKKLKERIDIAQNLKSILRRKIKSIDIKTINLIELFERDFLARQGILIEGYSLLHNIEFSKRLGFEGHALFTYNLKNLNHNEKTKFTYVLIGRNKEGIIKQLSAKPLGKGAVRVPIKNSLIFEEFLKKWKINYDKKDILTPII